MMHNLNYIDKNMVALQLQRGTIMIEVKDLCKQGDDEFSTVGVSIHYKNNGSPYKYELMSIEEDVDDDYRSVLGFVVEKFEKDGNEFFMRDGGAILEFNAETVKPDPEGDTVYCYG